MCESVYCIKQFVVQYRSALHPKTTVQPRSPLVTVVKGQTKCCMWAPETTRAHTHSVMAVRQCRSTHQAQGSSDDAAASPFLPKEISRLRPPGRRRRHLFKSNLVPKNFSSLLPPPLALDDVRVPYRCIPYNGVGGGARLIFSARLTETRESSWRSHFRGS